MAEYPMPPWLAGNPSQFVPEMAAKGASLATEANIANQQNATRMAAMASEQQQAAAALAERAREADISNQFARDELLMKHQEYEYQNQLAKQKLDLEIDSAKRKYAAQNKYQRMIASGIDPGDAMMQIGPELGESLTGMSQYYREMQRQKQMEAFIPKAVTVPGKQRDYEMIQKSPTEYVLPTSSKTSSAEATLEQKEKADVRRSLEAQIKVLNEWMSGPESRRDKKSAEQKRRMLADMEAQLYEMTTGKKFDSGEETPAGAGAGKPKASVPKVVGIYDAGKVPGAIVEKQPGDNTPARGAEAEQKTGIPEVDALVEKEAATRANKIAAARKKAEEQRAADIRQEISQLNNAIETNRKLALEGEAGAGLIEHISGSRANNIATRVRQAQERIAKLKEELQELTQNATL
jgi:hypothetical protein